MRATALRPRRLPRCPALSPASSSSCAGAAAARGRPLSTGISSDSLLREIPEGVTSKLGRNLHNTEGHPLYVIKKTIEMHFEEVRAHRSVVSQPPLRPFQIPHRCSRQRSPLSLPPSIRSARTAALACCTRRASAAAASRSHSSTPSPLRSRPTKTSTSYSSPQTTSAAVRLQFYVSSIISHHLSQVPRLISFRSNLAQAPPTRSTSPTVTTQATHNTMRFTALIDQAPACIANSDPLLGALLIHWLLWLRSYGPSDSHIRTPERADAIRSHVIPLHGRRLQA